MDSDNPIRILIVDDHPMTRDGLRSTIELERDMSVIGEAIDGEQAIEMHATLRPDVTLLDLQMPNVGGLQARTAIRKLQPEASVVVEIAWFRSSALGG